MATNLLSPQEIVALLAQNGVLFTDKEAFAKAFRNLYPRLSLTERAKLLLEILAYVDSVIESQTSPAEA